MMRKIVLIVPEWLGEPGEDSAIRELAGLRQLAETSITTGLTALRPDRMIEGVWLGLDESEADMSPGPLTVAGLGADPPERSTHFVLSLLSHTEDSTQEIAPTAHEFRAIMELLPKLNTKVLTVVAGEQTQHGLVWEGRGDLGTTPPDQIGSLRSSLPVGDGDERLRRLIDDSLNLLMEQEFNHQRLDEGRAPINLLWPWGQGERIRVPNLALRRGEPATVFSNQLRLAGLTRLSGYLHSDRAKFGKGTRTQLRSLADEALKTKASITVVDAFQQFRPSSMFEELDWFSRQLNENWIQPILEKLNETPTSLLVLAPSSRGKGLALQYEKGQLEVGRWPFDERVLEEAKLPVHDTARRIAAFLSP